MTIAVANITEIYMNGTALEVAGTLTGGATNETGLYFAGTGCYGQSFASGANEMSATITTSLDLSSAGSVVVFRFGHTTGLEVLDTVANGGLTVRVGSSSGNYEEYTVGGTGAINAGGPWVTIAIDPSITGTATVGTPNMAAATFFAIETVLSGEAGGDTDNQFLDMIIAVEGPMSVSGSTTAAGLMEDLVAWDDTNKYDLIRNLGGVYNVRGMIELESLTGATTIADKGSVIAFAPDEFYDGSNWVDTIAAANMGMRIVKGGTGAVDVTFGENLAGLGTNGIQLVGKSGIVFDASVAAINTANFYGCSIDGAIAPALQDGEDYFGTIFDNSGELDAGTGILRDCIIKGSIALEDEAAMLWESTTDAQDCIFLQGTTGGHGLRGISTGADSFTGIVYGGYFSVTDQTLHQFDNTTDVIGGATDTITLPTGHGYVDGDPVMYSRMLTANTVVTGLVEDQKYWVAVTGDAMTLHNSEADALVPTGQVNLTVGTGNETHALWPANAAFFNDSGGAITYNVAGGGGSPSVRNLLDSTTTVNASVTVQVTVLDNSTGSPIQDARVQLYLTSDYSTSVLNGGTNASGIVTASWSYASDVGVEGWARQFDIAGTDYVQKDISGTITANGLFLTVRLDPVT